MLRNLQFKDKKGKGSPSVKEMERASEGYQSLWRLLIPLKLYTLNGISLTFQNKPGEKATTNKETFTFFLQPLL